MNARVGTDPRVWRRCTRWVRELERSVGIPAPFDLPTFLGRLQQHRGGRPIELLALGIEDLPAGKCGLWLVCSDRDVIGYPAGIALTHQQAIALHEVGHMVAGHRGTSMASSDRLARLLPDLDPEMVRAVLGRSVYSDVEEREAEATASLIMQRSLLRRRISWDGEDAVTSRMQDTFGPAPD